MDDTNEPDLASAGAFSAYGDAASVSIAASGKAAPAVAAAGPASDVALPEGYLGGAEQ